MLIYQGYIAREKTKDYRAAWQIAWLVNAWVEEKITVNDILPWIPKEPVTENKRLESTLEREKEPESAYGRAVTNYALTAGIDLDELSPEERAEIEEKAINFAVASELNAPGLKMFKRKYYGKFPDD